MHVDDLAKKKLPAKPGVYFFLGPKKEILYIGKATTLKSRVRSYFDDNIHEKRSLLIKKLVAEARTIEWIETDSVLEAMLLEVNLIRTHKPAYNTKSKDDKSYNHVVITNDEFPRVLVIRGKDLEQEHITSSYASVFGPFPSGMLFKEALKIIRKLFQFYDIRESVDAPKNKVLRGKIDFNRQIGLYPDACTKAEYARTIKHIRLFFEGNKMQIVQELEKEMFRFAKKEEFEKANSIKRKIFALKHIQDVALIKDETRIHKDDRTIRIEAYDIAHMGGKDMVGVMTVLKGTEPEKSAYRKFAVTNFTHADDPGALTQVLQRRFDHPEWPFPDLIVVDGNTIQKNAAERVLEARKLVIPVVGVVKDEKHNPNRIIGPKKLIDEHETTILHANAEAHRFAITYHRKKRKIV